LAGRFPALRLVFLTAGEPAFFGVVKLFLAGDEPLGNLERWFPRAVAANALLFCWFEAAPRFTLAKRFFWAAAIRAFPSGDIDRFCRAGSSSLTLATRPAAPLGLPGPRRSGVLLVISTLRRASVS